MLRRLAMPTIRTRLRCRKPMASARRGKAQHLAGLHGLRLQIVPLHELLDAHLVTARDGPQRLAVVDLVNDVDGGGRAGLAALAGLRRTRNSVRLARLRSLLRLRRLGQFRLRELRALTVSASLATLRDRRIGD